MRGTLILGLLIFFSLSGFAQEIKKDNVQQADPKSLMVLRPNTRDQKATMHNNMRKVQYHNRVKKAQQQQKMIQHRRMNQIQQKRMRSQRIMQQRKIRQQAIRRRQMQGR